jgi:hypothetical protein
MIEQTPLEIIEWTYQPPAGEPIPDEAIQGTISLDVMKKRAPTKKGIACRFSCQFKAGDIILLTYTAEDSYVIDLADVIDMKELLTMLRNSFSKFNEKFELRKLCTILQNQIIQQPDESRINLEAILQLLH